MFNVGLPEILLIAFVVLLLFGSKRIPELARAVGRASAEYKKAKAAIANEGKELLAVSEKAAAEKSSAEKATSEPAAEQDKAAASKG